MNKNTAGIIITIVALVAVGGVILANNKDNDQVANVEQMPSMQDTMQSKDKPAPSSSVAASEVQSGTVTMDIKDFAYSKKSIKVKKGTKVVWTNRDSAKHDISPDDESTAFTASELLAQGKSYEFTFDSVGNYSYHCSPHPYMKASVEVVE